MHIPLSSWEQYHCYGKYTMVKLWNVIYLLLIFVRLIIQLIVNCVLSKPSISLGIIVVHPFNMNICESQIGVPVFRASVIYKDRWNTKKLY